MEEISKTLKEISKTLMEIRDIKEKELDISKKYEFDENFDEFIKKATKGFENLPTKEEYMKSQKESSKANKQFLKMMGVEEEVDIEGVYLVDDEETDKKQK